MAKFCFPSCCFCCSCFSSSSAPEEETIAGPSTSSPSSQPSQQPANAVPSTAASSSQPSQQPANAGPSTTTTFDKESFLHKFNDISELKNLIQFIEELLKNAVGEKNEEGSSSEVSSYIQDGQTFLEFVDKHISKLPQKKDSMDGLSAETPKILIKLLQGAGKIHWVGAALSVVGFALARYGQMSNNQRECLEILKAMVNLGTHIVKLNEQIPEQKQKLEEAVKCIVEGCIMCISQIVTTKIFRFLTASVNADSLKAFQLKIDRLYNDLQLLGITEIKERLPKIPSQSYDYANPGAVGVDSAREEVIKLLDLSAQHTSPRVVVVHGFGGIGKTTLADVVYDQIKLQFSKHCRIHMDQNCTKNDLKTLQKQILDDLFKQKVRLRDCDEGRAMIRSKSIEKPDQPLFLYIDNGLKSTDLEELVPADLGSWLPLKSRVLVTTRNLHETDTLISKNCQRQQYAVSPLEDTEARELLLKKVSDYNDEKNIQNLIKLCGGVPLLLELAGSQLAINSGTRNNIVLEMLSQGEKVEEKDLSDRMVDFVFCRLLPPVQEAFLDITSFFNGYSWEYAAYFVGEEEWRALEEASFIKKSGDRPEDRFIVHDIVQARGKKMSEQNRITDRESLSECLKDEEKLKNLKGIFFRESFLESFEQPPIEINENHLKCMSNSLRVLYYEEASQITSRGKCDKPFKQLRFLSLPDDVPDLPMEFEKLEHITCYWGPFTQGMSFHKLPPTLRFMRITNVISSDSGSAYSNIPSKDTQGSSLVELSFWSIPTMERLPDGMEKLTTLEKLVVSKCPKLRELPFNIGKLSNLEVLNLIDCSGLEEWPLSFGDLSKLKKFLLFGCSSKLKETLPHNIRQNCKLYND